MARKKSKFLKFTILVENWHFTLASKLYDEFQLSHWHSDEG